jgi:hypothetical protein
MIGGTRAEESCNASLLVLADLLLDEDGLTRREMASHIANSPLCSWWGGNDPRASVRVRRRSFKAKIGGRYFDLDIAWTPHY